MAFMNSAQYLDELEKKIEVRYQRERARYERDMEALARVRAIDSEGAETTLAEAVHEIAERTDLGSTEKKPEVATSPQEKESSVVAPSERNGAVERFSLRREIEKIIPELGIQGDITQGAVRQRLERLFPDHHDLMRAASVSSTLRRLADAGNLVLVSKGTGSEPNIYRLPEYVDNGNGQEELGQVRE